MDENSFVIINNSDYTNHSNAAIISDIGNDTFNLTRESKIEESNYYFHGYSAIIPLAIIMICIIVLAIGGNTMVILTILRHRGMRTRTNMFIVNLAVADILVAALDMPVSLVTIIEGDWIFGKPLCVLNGFTMALFLICSIHTLMYISVHKYISITRPFSRAMTPRRIKIMIAASWVWAAFCALGPVIGWNENVYKKGASQCGPAIPTDLNSRSHSLLITTSNFIIPLSVMLFCYYKIFREIHVHMDRIRKTSNIDLENSVQQQKKVATTLFLVLACFLLCWIPFVIYSNTLAFIRNKAAVPLIMNPLSYWCGYLNSACNPIIYAFRSPSFRKGYKEIMCGTPTSGLSAVNSMSFRSRSGRSSQKSTTNTVKNQTSEQTLKRQRTMLSQTSWKSLPLIPNLIRSLSTNKHERNSRADSPEEPETPEISGCLVCGIWKQGSSYETRNSVSDADPTTNITAHSLKDINEDNEGQIDEEGIKNEENVQGDIEILDKKKSFDKYDDKHCSKFGEAIIIEKDPKT